MECQPTGLFRDETWFLPLASLNLQKTPPQSHRSMLILSANKTLQCFSRETFYCPFSHPIPAHRSPDSAIPTPLSFLRSVFLAKGHNTWAQSWKKKKKVVQVHTFKWTHCQVQTLGNIQYPIQEVFKNTKWKTFNLHSVKSHLGVSYFCLAHHYIPYLSIYLIRDTHFDWLLCLGMFMLKLALFPSWLHNKLFF